jgi:glycosyltransferase involved in cell wall biosynthesis
MKPFFSVIVPTLNEEHYLPKLLNCLAKQTEKDFETIVVDRYSKDGTKKIVREYARHQPIRFFEIKAVNVSAQRNYGAKQAQGSYLIFLDADSQIYRSFIKKLKKKILQKKGLIFIPHIIPDEKALQFQLVFQFANFLIENSQNLSKPLSSGGNLIIEKNFFWLLGGFDEKLYLSEDHNLIQRASNWGVKTKYLKDIKVKFCLRRLKREGQLRVLYKYILATAHLLLKGDVKKKIFDYRMGGEDYQEKFDINKSLKQTKTIFKKILAKI